MSTLVEGGSLKEFFKAVIEEVIADRRLEIAEITEFYLVNLLSEFVFAEKLFTQDEEGKKDHEPLAFLYHRALQQSREERIQTLRRLGDVSLYKAGFFADSLRDAMIGRHYYVQMGETAYGQVADLSPSNGFGVVYRELCRKFKPLAEVLEEIAARGMASNGASGALKVYESWVRTGNDRLEKVLVHAGLMSKKPGLAN